MAKYTYTYACGHGHGEIQLFGKNDERERRLIWMSENMVCKDCYKAAKVKEDTEADPVYDVTQSLEHGLDAVAIYIIVTGQTAKFKEPLDRLGYTLQRPTQGLMGFFSSRTPPMVLCKCVKLAKSEDIESILIPEIKSLEDLGYAYRSGNDIDTALIAESLKRLDVKTTAEKRLQEFKDQWEVEHPIPIAPLRLRINKLCEASGGRWNGKIYGGPDSRNFYISGEKHEASEAEYQELSTIIKDKVLEAWEAQRKQAIAAFETNTPE